LKVEVRSGDTLYYYSQLFGVPLRLIMDSNNVNPDELVPGENISIPGYVKTSYTLKSGETLWSIATERGMDLDSVLLVNPGISPKRLRTGEAIQLPVRVARPFIKGKQSYDYATLMHDLNRLQSLFPFIQQRSIGRSVLGKSLQEIVIGRGEKQVHINAAFHAREWITTPVLMTFINQYLVALASGRAIRGIDVQHYYDEVQLSIVPMVNPDGVDLAIHGAKAAGMFEEEVTQLNEGNRDFSKWKANIRGVDLNDQFPADWDIEANRREQAPAPENYPGPAPLSEPESTAIANLTREKDFYQVIALHTQGGIIYWGFEGDEPQISEKMATEYARVSGYQPIRYVDSYAGYKDWFIQDWHKPGFTIELGRGESPLPLSQFDQIYQETLGILLASLYL
jgi:g-D-glutamyl-meso-diaminopimelate peptidase